MIKNTKIFSLLLIIFLSVQGCAQNNPSNTMTMDELKEKINKKDKTFIVLDVRTVEETKGSLPIIEEAIHIPLHELGERYHELEKYRDNEIAVICRTQNRSSVAAQFLTEKGYKARSVTGGMMEYFNSK